MTRRGVKHNDVLGDEVSEGGLLRGGAAAATILSEDCTQPPDRIAYSDGLPFKPKERST
jgi:hypothetical protein